MKRILLSLALASAIGIGFTNPGLADGTIDTLTAGSALAGTESIPMFQTANPAVKTTPSAISTYLQTLGVYATLTGTQTLTNKSISASQVNSGTLAAAQMPAFTGDATSSAGAVALTLATVNSNVGSFGSATNCITFTVNAKGLTTAASAATCTPALTSITGLGTGVATALAIAPGTTGSFPTQDGAITTGNCLKWGPGVQDAGAACGSGGAVSSVTGSIGVTCSPTTGSVICSTPATRRDVTTTTDTITSTDRGTIVTENNASSVAVAITTTGFVSTDYFSVKNLGAGVATYTPSSGTIDGAATLVCLQNQSADLYFDGTNYKTLASSCRLDVSGTAAMLTGAITSGSCATVVTVSAPGVATTDTVMFGYNGDPTAVTGYGASATGAVLSVYPYPSSGNVNVKICNSTASSITPGALTLNWRVVR